MKTKHVVIAGLLAFLLASPLVGQAPESNEIEYHEWVVLLDVSHSFRALDQAQSQALGKRDYKLRNELMSLLQTAMATLRADHPERRDYLTVYLFGDGVRRVRGLSPGAVGWSEIEDENWWDQQIRTDLGARTDLFKGLRSAKEHFAVSDIEGKKHLLLISDGELDTGTINRPPGGAMAQEELDRYVNRLQRDDEVMSWLASHDVEVLTLAIDGELKGANDTIRQNEIQRRLYDFQFEGDTPLDWGRALVEDLWDRTAASGKLPYSEGPYVMRTLAKAFGGQSRSVTYDNALDVLWNSFFDDKDFKRVRTRLTPDTRQLIVVAPIEAPVPLKIQDDSGGDRRLTLNFDPDERTYSVDPPGRIADSLSVGFKLTSQYVTWRILSPYRIVEFEADSLADDVQNRIHVLPISSVRLRWRENEPPDKVLIETKPRLLLELVFKPVSQGYGVDPGQRWSLQQWRETLEKFKPEGKATIRRPDGTSQEVFLEATFPERLSNVVLELEGFFDEATLYGPYEIDAELAIGETKPMAAPPKNFLVQGKPSPVTLFVRVDKNGEPGNPIRLDELDRSDENYSIEIDSPENPMAAFEWRVDEDQRCEDLEALRIELSAPETAFEPGDNVLSAGEIPADDGVCYQSPAVRLDLEPGGKPVIVTGHNGVFTWQRSIQIPEPPEPDPWWWTGCVLPLTALLISLVVLLLIPAVRRNWQRRYRSWQAIRQAKFPFAIEHDGKRTAWDSKAPKRLLVTRDGSGLKCEFTSRSPAAGDEAVELKPISKQSYQLRALEGSDWSYRRIPAGVAAGATSGRLGAEGEMLDYMDFVDETLFEVRHEAAGIAKIGHKTYF